MIKLIILDRDGVINYDSEEYIKSADEWQAIPGSLEAIAKLNQHGYQVVVVTNQSGLARGKFTHQTLDAIHQKMRQQLAELGGKIEDIFFCPHGPDEGCDCRKPRPGLFKQISAQLGVPLDGVLTVGDKLSDIEAAKAVGASPVLVKTGYGQTYVDKGELPEELLVYDDLAAVVEDLIPTS